MLYDHCSATVSTLLLDSGQNLLSTKHTHTSHMLDEFEVLNRVPESSTYEGPGKRDIDYEDIQGGEQIGAGGFARVSVVTVDGQDLIVKEPFIDGTIETDTFEAFADEAKTWSRLDDHPHIVNVVDWGNRFPWIVTEYMDGGSLAGRLDEEPLETTEALWIGIRLSQAVQHAHRHGVAHLDLTPSNILLRATDNGEWDVPKIGDWGMSQALLEQSDTVDGLTPNYAAPEQFDPDKFGQPDDFTDRFQLAVVLYEILTGEQAFPGSGAAAMRRVLDGDVTLPTAIDPNLPSDLDEIFDRALAPKKADRYETVVNLRRDLTAVLDDLVGNADGSSDAGQSPSETATQSTASDTQDESNSPDSDSEMSDHETEADVLSRRPAILYESAADIDRVDDATVDGLLDSVAFEADAERANGPLRLAVDSTHTEEGTLRVVVHVASGTLSAGADLEFRPSGATMRVATLEEYLTGGSVDVAEPGDAVTLVPESITNGEEITRGNLGGHIDDCPLTVELIEARLYVLDHSSVLTAGYTPIIHANTAQVAASIMNLERRLVPVEDETWNVEQSPNYAEPGDLVDVTLSPQRPLSIDPITTAPETGAFTVHDDGQVVALGIVTNVESTTTTTTGNTSTDTIVERLEGMDHDDGALFERLASHLDDETVPAAEDAPLRIPIQDVYTIDTVWTVPVGQVATGSMQPSDDVIVQPSGVGGEVETIERNHEEVPNADVGDHVSFKLNGVDDDDIRRGDLCSAADDPPAAVKTFEARLLVTDHPSVITAMYTPVVHVHTAQVACTIKSLEATVDPETGERTEENPDFVQSGDVADVVLEPQKPLSVEPVSDIPELGVFTVRDMGQAVGVGAVLTVTTES